MFLCWTPPGRRCQTRLAQQPLHILQPTPVSFSLQHAAHSPRPSPPLPLQHLSSNQQPTCLLGCTPAARRHLESRRLAQLFVLFRLIAVDILALWVVKTGKVDIRCQAAVSPVGALYCNPLCIYKFSQSKNTMRNISALILNSHTIGSFITFQHWCLFFSFGHHITPLATRPSHFQGAESLGSSCFPSRRRAPSRGSSLVMFPHPRLRSTPATGCSRSDSPKATKGARQFTGDFAENRGNLHEPGGANQRSRPSFEMQLLLIKNVHLQKRSPPSLTVFRGNVEKVVFIHFQAFW